MYSIRTFGMSYGRLAAPSSEMKSTPFGGSAADALHQRLLHQPLHEHGRLAGRIERAPHARVADRTVVVVLHVVFARPHDLHRLADRLRRFHRVDDEVGFAAPAEPAAQIRGVDLHLVGGQPGRRDRRLVRRGLALRRHVDVAAVGADVGRAVHRLHAVACARNGASYTRSNAARAPFSAAVGVAVVARDLARLLRQRRVFLA